MRQQIRGVLVCTVMLASSVGATGCGSSGKEAVARVGRSTVTRPEVDHWMKVLVAGDFHQELEKAGPSGLVSDPPHYRTCIGVARRMNARNSVTVAASLCRELDVAVKKQAVDFLIDALWRIEDASEHGERATSDETAQALRRIKRREWPGAGKFDRYLSEEHRSLGDELYLVKRNLLQLKLAQRLERSGIGTGDGARVAQIAREYTTRWVARTRCETGYITESCRNHRVGEPAGPSPNSLLLKLTGASGLPSQPSR